MRDELYVCCPRCESTWYIKCVTTKGALRNKHYECERCGFKTGYAMTRTAARMKWNRNARAFTKNYEKCRPFIMKLLERK